MISGMLLSSGAAGPSTGVLLVIVVVASLYFIPLIVASARHVPNIGSVAVINILLGWTFIGWVVALAMAARSADRSTVVNVTHQPYAPPPAPPGWYTVNGQRRWWDGSAWR